MSNSDEATRRVLGALRGGQENLDHPGHEILEAYIEGRLSPGERAGVDRLAARSAMVAEDLADLQAVRDTLRLETSHVPRDASRSGQVRWGRVAAIGAAAASVVIGVWLLPSRVQAPTRPEPRLSAYEVARVRDAVMAGKIAVPEFVAALRPSEGTLLGKPAPPTFRLRGPLGTLVPLTRPVFTWDDAKADAYTVAVFDQNFSEVARGRVTATMWRPDVDLPRDATYSWQVTAHRGSQDDTEPKPPRPEARFRVSDAATAELVTDWQRRLDANDPLSLGILLAERGFIADAREQLTRASKIPGTADSARQLLESLDQGTPITTKPAQ